MCMGILFPILLREVLPRREKTSEMSPAVAVLDYPGDLGDVLNALHGPGELRAHGEPRLLLAVARVPEPGGEAEHVRGVGAVQLTPRGLGAAAAPADEAVVVVGPAAADNGTVQSAG